MKPPASPDAAQNDDQVLAWVIRNGSDSDRRAIASDLGVSYPADVTVLGTTCDKGQAYVGVWVVNFSAKTVRWNVTMDGVGYAGAQVRARSLDAGAIGVPNGRHTIAFVNPATGAVATSVTTNITCGTGAVKPNRGGTPVATPPKRGSVPAGASSSHTTAPTTTSTNNHTTRPGTGPLVQADFVAPQSKGTGTAGAFALLAGLCAGVAAFARRASRR